MARLNIEARGSGRGGSDGGIIACVTDDTGAAVTDLEAGDFSLAAIDGGTGAQKLAVVEVRMPIAGIYVVRVGPAPPGVGSARVLAVVVARRFDRGQCLAEVAW